MTKTVVVTGASRFIGKRIVKSLVDHGHTVRGSVRSDAKADETRAAVGPNALDRLSFMHLGLMSDDGWDDALVGDDALIHSALPFPLGSPDDREELIRPAVDGTMRAALAAGVDRAAVTSSCVAMRIRWRVCATPERWPDSRQRRAGASLRSPSSGVRAFRGTRWVLRGRRWWPRFGRATLFRRCTRPRATDRRW